MGIEYFFSNLSNQLRLLHRARSTYEPLLAPNFNVFRFLNKNENGLSHIIAELLDPQGSHAQGNMFLKNFIEIMKVNIIADWDKALVFLEHNTNYAIGKEGRRIDIEVSLGTKGFGIENKPWAIDQQGQVQDYLTHLSKKYRDGYALLYLTDISGRLPSEHSISAVNREAACEQGHLILCSYLDIIEWLKRCKACCEAERVRYFINDFIKYCQQQFIGLKDMQEHEAVISYISASNENAKTAFDLLFAKASIEQTLLTKLEDDINSSILNRDLRLVMNQGDYQNYFKIQKKSWEYLSISFGFEYKLGGFYAGILSNRAEGVSQDIFLKMSEAQASDNDFDRPYAGNEYWSWYSYIPKYSIWTNNSDVWADIATGKMADFISSKALWILNASEPLLEAFEKNQRG